MGMMADALAWFGKVVDAAQLKTERENLLDELEDNRLARGDLHWQISLADQRDAKIRNRLRELDGIERRTTSVSAEPASAEGKNVHELQARFANKHPELAEFMRVRRYDDFHTEYWSNEVRSRESKEKVKP